MPVGKVVTVCLHEDSTGTAVLDSVTFHDWTHDTGALTGNIAVEKEDFSSTLNDSFCVQWSVVLADVASFVSKTGVTHLADAVTQVNLVFPVSGGVGPST